MFFSNKKKIKKKRDNLCKDADIFIQVHFVRERTNDKCKFNTLTLKSDPERDKVMEWYESHDNPESYSDIVGAYLSEYGKDENVLCDKFKLPKNYFSTLANSPSYIPSKGEALAICFAFHLTYEGARALLKSSNYALTNSEKTDLIVRYFLENGNYNLNDLNYVLGQLCDIKLADII